MSKKEPQGQETLWKSDPERYAKCSQPFADQEAATAAVEAFFDGVERLREEHLLCDVEIIVQDSIGKGADAGAFISTAHYGNSLAREAMLAYALGRATKDRESTIGRLLAGKSR